jgi:beta-lactamase superfamily II metal-dependent hydrolase
LVNTDLRSEINDNSVATRLTHGTARALLAGDAEAKITWRAVHARGLKRSSTFRNYIHSEPRFRALLLTDEKGDARFDV